MSSLKQIKANRRNALKSTGPTTPEGKERSRCDAVRHGLTAETVIAALEDATDYQAFEAAVIADYDVESAVERELVLRLASVFWQSRRAISIETAIFESVTAEPGKLEHPPHTGQLATSLQVAGPNLQSSDCQQYDSPLWSGLRRNRPHRRDPAPLRNRQPSPSPLERVKNGRRRCRWVSPIFAIFLVDANYRYMR